jgi:hypothetical protein
VNIDVVRSDIDNQAFSKVAFPKILIHEKLKMLIQFFEERNLGVFFLQLLYGNIFFFYWIPTGICPNHILGLTGYRSRSTLKTE